MERLQRIRSHNRLEPFAVRQRLEHVPVAAEDGFQREPVGEDAQHVLIGWADGAHAHERAVI